MRCSDIMKPNPVCLTPSEPAFQAARRMRDDNIGFVPVCTDGGNVVGAVTDRDLAVRLVANQLPMNTPIADVMTNEIVACKANDDLSRAQELMEKNHKSRIMVLDDQDHIAGIISLSDIAQRGDASGTLRQVSARETHA